MSAERSEGRRHRRRLSEDEQRLWGGITRSVVPLKRKHSTATAAMHRGETATTKKNARATPQATRRRVDAPAHPAPAKPGAKPPAKSMPSLGGLERRQKQRLARGTEPIDGRIDLHGRTQSEAHTALLGFLRHAQARGARFVLVITGKGGFQGAASERGVLKRQVPLWLRQAEFRPFVLAAEDAHRAHGGEGALYIRIRRLKG